MLSTVPTLWSRCQCDAMRQVYAAESPSRFYISCPPTPITALLLFQVCLPLFRCLSIVTIFLAPSICSQKQKSKIPIDAAYRSGADTTGNEILVWAGCCFGKKQCKPDVGMRNTDHHPVVCVHMSACILRRLFLPNCAAWLCVWNSWKLPFRRFNDVQFLRCTGSCITVLAQIIATTNSTDCTSQRLQTNLHLGCHLVSLHYTETPSLVSHQRSCASGTPQTLSGSNIHKIRKEAVKRSATK